MQALSKLGGALVLVALLQATPASASGPFGIDHRVNEDASGIWKRSNQTALLGVMVVGGVGARLLGRRRNPAG